MMFILCQRLKVYMRIHWNVDSKKFLLDVFSFYLDHSVSSFLSCTCLPPMSISLWDSWLCHELESFLYFLEPHEINRRKRMHAGKVWCCLSMTQYCLPVDQKMLRRYSKLCKTYLLEKKLCLDKEARKICSSSWDKYHKKFFFLLVTFFTVIA